MAPISRPRVSWAGAKPFPDPGAVTVRLPAIAATAKAVMLIKLPNRTGPVTISNAPTSHVDLPSTILEALGLPGAAADGLMFERDPRQPRTRLFGMYNPHVRFPTTFLDRLDVLTIDGRLLDAASWNVKRLIWRPDVRLEERDVISVPARGNSFAGPAGRSSGVKPSPIRADHVCASADGARRHLVSLPARAGEVVLRASTSGASSLRSVQADVDGRPAGQLSPPTGDGYRDIVIRVPADASRPVVSDITLHFDSGG